MEAYGHGKGDILYPGQTLQKGEHLRSRNGLFSLVMQPDGDLVSYKDSGNCNPTNALFHSNTVNEGFRTVLHADGHLVVQNLAGGVVWSSCARPLQEDKYWLVLQNDANSVIYSSADEPVWSNQVSCKAFRSA